MHRMNVGTALRTSCVILSGLGAGGSPAATHFSCFAKKSKQKKATRGSSPRNSAGYPALLETTGRCGTRARGCSGANCYGQRSPSNSPRGMPLSFLRYSATLIGARSHFRQHRARHGQFAFCDCKNLVSFVPRKWPRVYMVVEVRLGPHERSRAAATNLGSPSFGYFSWRSKKRSEHGSDVFLPPGNPRHRSQNKYRLKSTTPPSQPSPAVAREGVIFARSGLPLTPAKYRKENKQRQQYAANQKENLPPRLW